jgi:multiple sugar transport system permease protein
VANPKKGTSQARNEFIWGWAFILPTMLGLIILNIYPIFKTIYESFFKTGDFGKGNIFIGFDNYVKLFHDAEVWQALLNTFKYAIVEVPFSIAIALVLAVLLNRKMKGRAVYRTIFFLPMVAAPAAIAMVWRWLFNSEFGLLNHIFHTKINWISDPKIAVYAIAVIGVWSIIGYNMVLFLSGLQEIPRDYYEAASIDGATGIKQFFHTYNPVRNQGIPYRASIIQMNQSIILSYLHLIGAVFCSQVKYFFCLMILNPFHTLYLSFLCCFFVKKHTDPVLYLHSDVLLRPL